MRQKTADLQPVYDSESNTLKFENGSCLIMTQSRKRNVVMSESPDCGPTVEMNESREFVFPGEQCLFGRKWSFLKSIFCKK